MRTPIIVVALMMMMAAGLWLGGCDSEAEPAPSSEPEPAAEVAEPEPEPDPLPPVAIDDGPGEVEQAPHTQYMVSEMRFTFEEGGVAPGFDLDGHVSSGIGDEGCGVSDFVSPEGEEGVDNQLALLMPFVELAGISQLPDYLQGAIVEGGILILPVAEGVDDPDNDDDITLTVLRGTGRPLVDQTQAIEPWQTLGVDHEDPVLGVSEQAWIEDGVVYARFSSMRLPAVLFDVSIDLDLKFAMFRIPLNQDDPRPGYGSGGVSLDALAEIIGKTPSGNLDEVLTNLGPSLADLDPDGDGECDHVSAALEMRVVPAFIPPDDLDMARIVAEQK